MPDPKKYDILVVGSGFAGSITALCLNSAGFTVCLVEKDQHPRFTIGESSTPIADMILRDLAEKYDLPELGKLSRYGLWQKFYPEVTCGIKRGFSYYKHSKDEPFTTDTNHSRELLVAASVDNENSDTQWYRPETDHLFVQMVMDAEIDYFDQTEIQSIKKSSAGLWRVRADHNGDLVQFETEFIIDATGSSRFSNRFFETSSSSSGFHTNTRAIYSHFENVPEWHSILQQDGVKTDDYPYNPDHSALHHILDEGWLWMLRFNDERLSAGLVLDQGDEPNQHTNLTDNEIWRQIIKTYPSLQKLFNNSKICDYPGSTFGTGRLQRRLDRMYGDGWAALHHTAGFVDPLHSTGIAHTLKGVEMLVQTIRDSWKDPQSMHHKLENYQYAFFRELELIDQLVASCYSARKHFDLFTASTMLYFVCSIYYEQKRLNREQTDHFLGANHPGLMEIVDRCFGQLSKIMGSSHQPTATERAIFVDFVRNQISPFNSVGLMHPSKQNLYTHTAVEM